MLTVQVLVARKQRLVLWNDQYWKNRGQKLEDVVGCARAFNCVAWFGVASKGDLSEVAESPSSETFIRLSAFKQ